MIAVWMLRSALPFTWIRTSIRALRLKAAATDRSISEIVNEAVRRSLAEDAIDLAAIERRVAEPEADFAVVVKGMKRRGRL